MANRTYNKVKIDGVVKLDLSSDTVTADKLLKDTTAHNHLGAAITGTYEPPTFTTQTKSATPAESTQEITPDASYDGLSKVTVGAISSTYVGTGVSRKSSTDLTVSGATVSVPAGYYANAASKSVASGTAGTPSASKGSVSNNSISVTPSVTNTTGYITGGTKTGAAVTVSASELVSGTKSITTTASIDVTNYRNAQVSDINLVAANIKKDATILGVTGSDKVRDVSDTTATAATVKSGSYFYNSSGIYTGGTMVTQDYYTGTSDPASSLGNNGDLYLKTT